MERISEAIGRARAERERMLGRGRVVEVLGWADLAPFEPRPETLARNRIVTLAGGREATAFDMLRTKLVQVMSANNWTRVAITSPSEGAGKSTLALNLALSLARRPERRTLLCGLDLRRPRLPALLGLPAGAAFSEVLEGRLAFADCALRIGQNLAIAANSAPSPSPAELLNAPLTGQIIDAIERDFRPDTMIFDTAPLLSSDDTMAILGHVDCVLLVAEAERSTLQEIDQCERELASQTNVLGVVLNKCRLSDQASYG